jgi:hypothetical protein
MNARLGTCPASKLDEDIDVALGPEVVAEDGAEEREPGDVTPPAQRQDGRPVDRDSRGVWRS